MTGSWRPDKLVALAVFYLAVSLGLVGGCWSISRRSSPQRSLVSEWSPATILVVTGTLTFIFAIYYPLPYYNHHADKLYLLLALLLTWTVWLLVAPQALRRAVNSRVFFSMRVVLFNLLLFLLIAEGTLRAADSFLARSGLFDARYNTPFGLVPHRPTEGSIGRTNASGFRDRERSLERTSQAPRILAVGDSFTMGAGITYDQIFVTLLEQKLQADYPGAEILNLGASGFQPDEYLSVLAWHGVQYRPDLVLMHFYLGNDFLPSEGTDMVVAGLRWKVHIGGSWVHDHFSWDHWFLFHDLNYAYKVGQARLRGALSNDPGIWNIKAAAKPASTSDPIFTGWSADYLRIVRSRGDQYLKSNSEAFTTRWVKTRETLEKTKRLMQSHQIDWALVLIPAEEQVDSELQKLCVGSLRVPREQLDFDKPQRVLYEWARLEGVPVIDLTDTFRLHVPSGRLFQANDFHWNEAGHALAATAIFPSVKNLLSQASRKKSDVS